MLPRVLERATKSRGRRVYLVSTAGFPNYGDEIVVRRMLSFLAAREPDTEVWVDCPNPGTAATIMRKVNRNARFTDTLYRLCSMHSGAKPAEVAERVIDSLENPGNAPRFIAGIEVLTHSDIIHILGGAYLNNIWPFHIGIPAAVAYLARTREDVRAAMTGCSLVPLIPESECVWAEALPALQAVSVIDRESIDFCHRVGAPEVARGGDDLYFGGLDKLYAKNANEAPSAMVCVQHDMLEKDFDIVVEFVGRVLETWGLPSEEIGFVECIPWSDREIYMRLQGDFPDARFFSFWDIMRDGFPAAAHQRWISTRFHPHLLAASAGASGIALNIRDDYYALRHSSLIEDGSDWVLANPSDSVTAPGTAGRLPEVAAARQRSALATAMSIYR